MLVDSHCHLDFPDFADDLDQVVERAAQAGVGVMVTICTRLTALETVFGIAERYPRVWCAVGIHPHNVGEQGVPSVERLVEIAAHPRVVGIGETGLDYFYDRSPRDLQRESFRVHIEAARRTGLPFIVHTRDAEADTAAILSEALADAPVPGLMHCFSGTAELAELAVKLGMYVSLSGIVTFRTAETIRAAVRDMVPVDRLLVETDAPFLAPVPRRGKRNEPALVRHTAATAAAIKGMSEGAFAKASTDNFFRLFRKVARPDG
ncbi:MAG: TatD family hydrolase [Alphaproteobacteria bacterium]